MSSHFLLAHWGGPGNLSPMLTAARRLARRGHDVRILGSADAEAEIEACGFRFRPWSGEQIPPPPPTSAGRTATSLSDVAMLCEHVMFGPAASYAADILEELEREPADAVLAHDFLFGAALAAEAARVPCALLSPHISVRPLPGLPPATLGTAPPRTAEERAQADTASEEIADAMNAWLPMFNDLRALLGLSQLDHVYEQYDRVDRVLLGVSAAFDFPCQNLPSNVRYVGPLLDVPGWSKPWRAPWSASPDRPRILVSFSTTFQAQAPVLQRILEALGHLHVDAVVTTGPAIARDALIAPPNVTLVDSAPHDTVMKEVSLVITHGGHGTVTRSLVHGVPLLVMAMGRDQGDNAARVVERGAGLSLTEGATPNAIAAAVNRLVADPRFRAAARHLGEAIGRDLTSSVMVSEMESIVDSADAAPHSRLASPIGSHSPPPGIHSDAGSTSDRDCAAPGPIGARRHFAQPSLGHRSGWPLPTLQPPKDFPYTTAWCSNRSGNVTARKDLRTSPSPADAYRAAFPSRPPRPLLRRESLPGT